MDKYKCWDCEKEIDDLNLGKELKEKCPKGKDGSLYVICNDCKENEEI